MGILNKLFGGKKGNNVTPTTETMSDDQFWNIIHLSYKKGNGDFEAQQDALKNELLRLSPQDILLFDNKFRKLRGDAYNWDLWGAIYIIHGGCGDDSFIDFRDWVIAQGKEFYYKTIANPETLVQLNKEQIEVEWEGMGYIPRMVFEEVTGTNMPEGYIENQEITGEEWSEDNDDLKNRFPLLWEKYS